MKRLLLAFLIGVPVIAHALPTKYDVTIAWLPVKQDITGKPIIVKGYNVYLSSSSFSACPSPTPTYALKPVAKTTATEQLLQLYPGDYYLTVTAYTDKQESVKSTEINFSVPTTQPNKPKIIQLKFKE